jgi:hypothetical protein
MGIPCQTRWNPLKKWFVFEKKKAWFPGWIQKPDFWKKEEDNSKFSFVPKHIITLSKKNPMLCLELLMPKINSEYPRLVLNPESLKDNQTSEWCTVKEVGW